MIGRALIAGVLSGTLTLLGAHPALDEIRDLQWHLDYLDIDQAHTVTKGRGVIVGVVDSGIDASHPDLVGGILPGTDFTTSPTADGWRDVDGHGTAMAGLIAAAAAPWASPRRPKYCRSATWSRMRRWLIPRRASIGLSIMAQMCCALRSGPATTLR